ncbi:unnamed protein product [Pipistrellus nathusii]|uniref:Uncharacterized protein n=1 Tax=Pipistrellus nathusii TaxID=59473 RepID=A0ABN9Z6V5_PIPNA
MHNEGAPRLHAGAPGPLLYLKPRCCERVSAAAGAQRIRSPGSSSPEKPPPPQSWKPGSRSPPAPTFFFSRKGLPGARPRPGVASGGGGGDAGGRGAVHGLGAMREPAAAAARS